MLPSVIGLVGSSERGIGGHSIPGSNAAGTKTAPVEENARAAILMARAHPKRSPRTKGHDARGRGAQRKLITKRT
jgi:hypothetical protein